MIASMVKRTYAPGDRVVFTAASDWVGRVFVIVEHRRVKYIAVDETTGEHVLVRPEHIRPHYVGEPLVRTAAVYAGVSGGAHPIDAQRAVTPAARARQGQIVVVTHGKHEGTTVRVSAANARTYSGTIIESRTLRVGAPVRVGHDAARVTDEAA